MPWLPPKGLDRVKTIACNKGQWEDLGNGYVTKAPAKKKTSVQVVVEAGPDDKGQVRLRVNPLNGGPAPRVHWANGTAVTTSSAVLEDLTLSTTALRLHFLVVDPTNKFETGDVVTWTNQLVIRNQLIEDGAGRRVKLLVAPKAEVLRYTVDGSQPRDGKDYAEAITIGDDAVRMLVFAEAEGIEARETFTFPERGKIDILVPQDGPVTITRAKGFKLDARAQIFDAMSTAKGIAAKFDGINLSIGSGASSASVIVQGQPHTAVQIEQTLTAVTSAFSPDVPATMSFRKAWFQSGHDMNTFVARFGIVLTPGEVGQ